MIATRKAIVALSVVALLGFAIFLARSPQPPAETPSVGGAAAVDRTGTGNVSRSTATPAATIEASAPRTTPSQDAMTREEVGAKTGPITVRVIDATTEDPVAGLALLFRSRSGPHTDDDDSSDQSAITDEDGVVQFTSPSAVGVVLLEDPFLYLVDTPSVRTSEPGNELRIARGGAVRGSVLSPSGLGAEGVTVQIDHRSWPGLGPEHRSVPKVFRRETRTDSSGSFTLPAVPIGEEFMVEARLGACRLASVGVTLSEPDRVLQVAPILLPPVGAIRVVLSPDADPYPGRAEVRVGTGGDYSLTSIGSASGSLADGVVLDSVPIGAWTLEVTPEHGCNQRIRNVRVEVGGTTEVGVVVTPGRQLRGALRAAGGAPLAGHISVLQNGRFRGSESAGDGQFLISGLTPGSAILLASALDHSLVELTIDITETMAPMEIVLDPTPDRMIQVTWMGAPHHGTVWVNSKTSYPDMKRVTLDDAGRGRVPTTSNDPVEVCVWTPDYLYGGSTTLRAPLETDEIATVDLTPALTISGNVLNGRTGTPIEYAVLSVSPQDGGQFTSAPVAAAASDSGGRFTIAGLLAGDHWIEVSHSLFENARLAVPGRSGAVSMPAISLTPLLTAAGGVFDQNGGAVEGARIKIRGQRRSTRSDTAGAFELALPVGKQFQVKIYPPPDRRDIAGLETTLPAERRDHHGLRFELPDARSVGGQIAGTVLDSGRFVIDSVEVIPFDPRRLDSRGQATLDQVGRYEVLALKPGQYVVIARAGSNIAAASVVDVALGEETRCDLTTGRATLIVNIVARPAGDPVPEQEFKIATILGARTGPRQGEARRVDPRGQFREEIPSGVPYHVFVGEDDDEAKAIESFTPAAGETREITLTIDLDPG